MLVHVHRFFILSPLGLIDDGLGCAAHSELGRNLSQGVRFPDNEPQALDVPIPFVAVHADDLLALWHEDLDPFRDRIRLRMPHVLNNCLGLVIHELDAVDALVHPMLQDFNAAYRLLRVDDQLLHRLVVHTNWQLPTLVSICEKQLDSIQVSGGTIGELV